MTEDVKAALHALVGSPCLAKLGDDSEVQGRIIGIDWECNVDDVERAIDLTIFVVDLGFGDLRKLPGAKLSLMG